MFAGEVLCLIVYITGQYFFPSNTEGEEPDAPLKYRLLFFIPAICDVLNVAFSLTGLTMTAAGVYQMLNGGVSFWTFALSICYLKTPYFRQHYLGVLTLITGLALVGVASIVWSKVIQYL